MAQQYQAFAAYYDRLMMDVDYALWADYLQDLLQENGVLPGESVLDCASVILWTAEMATKMAGDGIQIFGGNGYINEYPLGRLWRDAKLYEIGAGTSEIRRMLIGRELFAETC